ncbi:glucose 1-dehydrogenase [Salicibibacter kimchii]|uniref:SDR family NAD(P)-dependent oxidoreductase n=1 Tax=Salicibibacter kimchii TaxID=2099786 RepID=A0A345C448_9BACI|nr:glucose 1-dehydrogenase [Salicibibacter kimchii]AXF57979.1 SDR family NAD(P)-dependent oxidoreductase [Salicibibacter kimchii]
MGRLDGKVALITGGSSGLGAATGKRFAQEGAIIVLSDINEENGQEKAREIQDEGGRALFLRHDITKENEWENVINKIVEEFGGLNAVVNCAGIEIRGNVEEISLDDWKRTIDVNLSGVFLGTKHGILGMKNSRSEGSIINLSSIQGIIGNANIPAYDASKGGVRGLTKSAALHCAQSKYNIRVNSIHPGYIKTPMVKDSIEGEGGYVTEDELNSWHPVGHIGEPNDIANGALYLASEESKFVTGSELVIDGGYTAW